MWVTPSGKIGSWICGIGSGAFGKTILRLGATALAEFGIFAKSQSLPKANRLNRCARLASH
jgi:hypothetical protein